MTKRLITKKQEQALRLCHQNFGGLSQEEAAAKMNISLRALGKLLNHVKEILPDYFPILTNLEAKIYHYFMIEGWGVDEISEYTELSQNAIYLTLQRARDKGMFFANARGRVLSYNSDMDTNIKHKF